MHAHVCVRVGLSLEELLQNRAKEKDHHVVARDPVDTVEAVLAPECVCGWRSNRSVKGRRRMERK